MPPRNAKEMGMETVRITGTPALLQMFLSVSLVSDAVRLVTRTCGQRPSCVRRYLLLFRYFPPCRPALAGVGGGGPKKFFTVARTPFWPSWPPQSLNQTIISCYIHQRLKSQETRYWSFMLFCSVL